MVTLFSRLSYHEDGFVFFKLRLKAFRNIEILVYFCPFISYLSLNYRNIYIPEEDMEIFGNHIEEMVVQQWSVWSARDPELTDRLRVLGKVVHKITKKFNYRNGVSVWDIICTDIDDKEAEMVF